MTLYTDATKRHDFVMLFDVTDGNPNGDPDADNMPRTDFETGQGLVTDVCLKRKVRNYVAIAKAGEPRYNIYVEERAFLVDQKEKAYTALEIEKGTKDMNKILRAQEWMCENYYDIRMFGGVLVGKGGEGCNCGQVRGPMQLVFSRSIDTVMSADMSITRVALENRKERKQDEDGNNVDVINEDEHARTGTFGRKTLVHYGLYRCYGFFTPHFAKKTGVNNDDLAIFWEALQGMWDLDHSATRGLMSCRKMVVFSHEKPLGNAPAQELFSRVQVQRKPDVDVVRKYEDYNVTVDMTAKKGITIKEII